MIVREKSGGVVSAAEVYRGLLWANREIKAVTGAIYPNAPHGVYPWNKCVVLSAERRVRLGAVEEGRNFAIGTLVYQTFGYERVRMPEARYKPERDPSCERSRWGEDTGQLRLPGLELKVDDRTVDFSMVDEYDVLGLLLVDFECAADLLNLGKIISALETYDRDWSLIRSGASYHLVLLEPCSWPFELIERYAGLVMLFAGVGNPFLGHVFSGWGRDLLDGSALVDVGGVLGNLAWMRDERKVVLTCLDILKKIRHVGEPDDGRLTFIIDLRHMAHTILDIISAWCGETDSFGVLRVNKRSPYEQAPLEVARKQGESVRVFEYAHELFVDGQLRLPI